MVEITLQNPQNGVLWRKHLKWMIENLPTVTWLIFEGEQLVEYLNAFVAHCVEFRGNLMNKGKTEDEAEEMIAKELLSQFSIDKEKQKPLTEEQIKEIYLMVETLPEKDYVVEIGR